ncbi:MAG: type II secretion system protein GspL [Burkholderiales bacterium]
MILRLLLPAVDRLDAATPVAWSLSDGRGRVLREATTPLAEAPRAERVEAVLPASRVLSARLKLPKVNAATIRELLPFAVEDRLLADPAQIHAVPGPANALGETPVAVVDRAWFGEALAALAGAGLAPTRAICESALLPARPGAWHAVLGAARSFLVEDDGHAVAFDRPAGAEPPLALRIAADEAAQRGLRPSRLDVLVEPGLAMPDAALWGEVTGVEVAVAEARPPLAAPAAATAIDLLAGDFAPRSARAAALRLPRLAWALAAAIVVLQFGLTLADWWRLERERRGLEAEREAIFRAAFPEAKTVVDPALQLRRNLADLQRTRGRAAANDFLSLATDAARSDATPARRMTYAAGRLEITRAEAAK